jgi:hypothetical protein
MWQASATNLPSAAGHVRFFHPWQENKETKN